MLGCNSSSRAEAESPWWSALRKGQYRGIQAGGGAYHQELVPRPVEYLPERHQREKKSVMIRECGHLKAPAAGNVQLGCKRHMLADFGDAACTRIVQEPFEMVYVDVYCPSHPESRRA